MLSKSHPREHRGTDLTSRQANCLCQSHTGRSKHACFMDSYKHAPAILHYKSMSWEKTYPTRCTIAWSGSDGASAGGAPGNAPILAYPYKDSDGKRQKATIEHVFPALEQSNANPSAGHSDDVSAAAASSSGRPQAPWQMGWQMNERNLYWNDELKVRLIKRIASDELGVSEDEMEDRLHALGALLPGLEGRLSKAPPKLVARLAANPARVAERLLRLRTTFPQANLSVMVSNRLTLLTDDDSLEAVAAAGERLRQLLPQINVDKFVEAFPLVLDVECFEMAMEDARRIMPGVDITSLLRSNPDIILSLVKGKALLPYDQISNPWT